jgi:hypothetical protein
MNESNVELNVFEFNLENDLFLFKLLTSSTNYKMI